MKIENCVLGCTTCSPTHIEVCSNHTHSLTFLWVGLAMHRTHQDIFNIPVQQSLNHTHWPHPHSRVSVQLCRNHTHRYTLTNWPHPLLGHRTFLSLIQRFSKILQLEKRYCACPVL
jgi:hypothetical protein